MYLQKLLDLVKNNKKNAPFVCIQDLVKNGLSLDRFTTDNLTNPCRHEITVYNSQSHSPGKNGKAWSQK